MNFTTETFRLPSVNGKTQLYVRCAVPEGPICGILQISHGMCEYIDRYEEVFSYYARRGFLVCGNDHLGHGNSASPEEYGFFDEKNGADYLVEDVHALTLEMKRRYPDLPYFLLGHSMGSFIARGCLAKYGKEYTGGILSGTGGPNPLLPAGLALTKAQIALHGPRYPGTLVDKIAFGNFNDKCVPRRTDKDWLTRDTFQVNRYRKDSMCTYTFTVGGFQDLFLLNKRVNNKAWAQSIPKQLPLYFFSGDMDPVGDYGKGVKKVVEMLREAGVQNVTLKLYPGGRHEMFNEINRIEVYDDLCRWLESYCPACPKDNRAE